MPSWKTLAAAIAATCLATAARAQTCASPLTAVEGNTPISVVAGTNLALGTACNLGGDNTIYNVVFCRFVAPRTASFTVQTCGSVNFDSRLAVMLNCSNPATTIACNDDAPGCMMAQTTLEIASKLTFNATAGTAYYVAVGGYGPYDTGSGLVNISSGGGGGGGSGSDCASATAAVDGANALDNSANTGTLDLTGLCDPGAFGDDILHNARWFRYVATSTGTTEFSTCGAATFDTRIAVLSGCEAASVLGCNDDGTACSGFTSQLQLATVAGRTYYVVIGGFDVSQKGTGTLTITPNAAPPDSCGHSANDCCVAGTTPFCSDSDCCSAVCSADSYCCNTQWDSTCAGEAAQVCVLCGAGSCTLPGFTTREAEPCGQDTNGGCNANQFAAEPIALGDRVAGRFWADGGTRDTDWYQFTVASGTRVDVNLYSKGPGRVFLVDTSCPPVVLASSPAAGSTCPANANLCVPAGTYRIIVAMTVYQGFPCSSGKNDYVLTLGGVACDAQLPPNDECTNALTVPNGATAFDSTFATDSAPPLDAACDEGFGTVITQDLWFRWTATTTGVGTASLCNAATFDTRLAVYADCAGTLLACNDDAPGCNLTSEVQFPVTAGTTYLVRVGGYSGGGTGTLTMSAAAALPNDDCQGAITIGDGDTAFDTANATDSAPPLDPVCDEGGGLAIHHDIWFRYVATCSGPVVASTCGQATFDTRLAVYASCDGVPIACNDDGTGCPGFTSLVQFTGTAGASYLIRVGGFASGGSGTLSMSCGTGGTGPANDTCPNATIAVNGANPFSNIGSVSDAPTDSPAACNTAGTSFYNDVWFQWTATQAGTATFSTCGSASFDTRLELWSGCPGTGGAVVACNDDGNGCAGFTSVMTATVTCGTRYYVRVGAYGTGGLGTGTLTITPGSQACAAPCPADLNGDRVVNGADLGMLLGNWGNPGTGDINHDGVVNGADLGALLGAYGSCP